MAKKGITIFDGMYFGVSYSIDEKPNNEDFKLHNHPDVYELVLFMGGEAEFHVEGNIYKLKPYDIVIARPFEMHHIVCLSDKPYERFIIYFDTEYFEKNRCGEFLPVFNDRELGVNNLIPSDFVHEKLIEPINKIRSYTDKGAFTAANGVLIEFLYLINNSKFDVKSEPKKDGRINSIITYINSNLTEHLTLDSISEKFYINKYHLCKIFKKNTGYTLNHYINYKRILLARELYLKGQSLTEASSNAGFNNYSHFYKMYTKQIGESPKKMTE